jgi:diguanylate cyclase (GGDEF)-like protein/PAS domain S-box-containing protein
LSEENTSTLTPTDPNFYKQLLDKMTDGVYFVDRDRRILYWNEGAFRLTGYTSEELVGRRCYDDTLCHVDSNGRSLCRDGCPLTASISDGQSHESQIFLRHRRGRRVPVWVRVQPIVESDGTIVGAVEIFSDNTAECAAQSKTREMERLAFLDPLTQIANRRYLEMSLHTALREYEIHEDPFGLLLIDFDRFKAINDGFGHAAGDRALQEVAKTLAGALRGTDILGRWGGDEFLGIVRHVNDEVLRNVSQRCCTLVRKTEFAANDERRLSVSISVGAYLVKGRDTYETALATADELMYRSKANGGNQASLG